MSIKAGLKTALNNIEDVWEPRPWSGIRADEAVFKRKYQ